MSAAELEALNDRLAAENSRLSTGISAAVGALEAVEEVVWFDNRKTLHEHLKGLLNPSTPQKRGECPLFAHDGHHV